MSYLVLARKYRPQTFSEVVGQEHVTRTLANAFSQDRVHHAFLFCGPRGVGKTTAARILAKALSCERGPTAQPCGECSACTTISQGTAVDVMEMDGASNRGIDAIRELTEAVRYQPAILRKKVYVIDEVHMLTAEAFNALLKTLEEPPPHVTFVLATTEPHKLPNTILSRCQRYDFKLVPMPRLVEHLQAIASEETLDIEPGAISLIAREAGGSVRDALSLADQVISYVGDERIGEGTVAEILGVADRALTRTLVKALAGGDAAAALEAVDAAVRRGVDEVQIARAIVRYLRDLAVLQVAPKSPELVEGSEDEVAELGKEAAAADPSRVRQMFERMNRACEDLGRTQQPRLVLELALIEVAALEPLLPLGDLIERLGELEERLEGGGSVGPPRGQGRGGGSGSGGASSKRGRASGAASANAPASASAGGSAPAISTESGQGPFRAALESAAAESASASASPSPNPSASPSPNPSASPSPNPSASPSPNPSATPDRNATPTPEAGPTPDRNATPNPEAGASLPFAAATDTPTPEAMREWDRIISELLDAGKLTLSAHYQEARLLKFGEGEIEVGFPPGELGYELASEPDNIRGLKEFLQARYGTPVEFRVRSLSPEEAEKARSLVEIDRERERDEQSRRESEARSHPLTRMVLETFGATIEEVKPLGS